MAEVLLHVHQLAPRIRGVRIVDAPEVLRHFTAELAPSEGELILGEALEESVV